MSEQELLYTLALTKVLPFHSREQQTLLDIMGSATAVYESRREIKGEAHLLSPTLRQKIDSMEEVLPRCEQELNYARAHQIEVLTWQDDARYPARLRGCGDAPLVLYFLGHADLNAQHIISIVGTRHCTERGRELCTLLARGLAELCPGTLVVSGLAYGIDVSAHRAALATGLPTLGVLAHGLDEIYPRLHRQTAIEMLKDGGLLTEFMSKTPIDRLNFLQRNRIVAGIADATIVVESPARGGSLSTARLSMDYNREVFAFPGRPTDKSSEGCNLLIRRHGAKLITTITDVIEDLGWQTAETTQAVQTELFPTLTPDEQRIVEALKATEADRSLADLSSDLSLPTFRLTPLLVGLEIKGVVKALPGARYHLVNA